MKKLNPLVLGVTLSTALVGCISADARLTDAQNALNRHIANDLRAKAAKGAFYSSYNIPSDAKIQALYGAPLTAEELTTLRKLAEEYTRHYEKEIVWPEWIKAIKAKKLPLAEAAYRAGDYDQAREYIWCAAATGVKPVDAGVREFGFEFLNKKVNPEQWRKIEKEMCETVIKFEKDGKYNEAIEWLKTVPYVREYSTVLDAKLKLVKDEMIKLSVPEVEAQPIIDATTALLDKVEKIFDYTDGINTSSSSSAEEVDLEAYNRAVENFRKTLIRHNCTEVNATKLTTELTTAAAKLFESLYTTTTSTTGNLVLGTGAINKRIDARREAMTFRMENLRDPVARQATLFALFDANDLAGVRAFLKKEMEAVLIESLTSTVTTVPGQEVYSPLDLAFEGEQLRYTIHCLAERQERFADAREVIWATIFPKKPTVRSEYLRPIGTQLMLTTVNATHWYKIEKDIAKTLLEEKDPVTAIQKLTNYPHIKTYAQEIDTRLMDAAKTAGMLGSELSADQIKAIEDATAEMKNLVDYTDKMANLTTVGKPINRDTLDLLLQEYRATLIQNDCTPENADKLIAMFNEVVNIDANATAKDTTTEVLHLGCNALNARIDKLNAAKIAELEVIIATAKAEEEAAKAEAEAAKAAEKAFVDNANDFCKRVYEATIAKDFETARNLVRDEPLTGNDSQDARMYIVRVGMLNSTVNPAQYEVLSAELQQQVATFVKAGDYEALKQYIENYPYVKDEYAKIDEALAALKGTIIDLPVAEAPSADYVTDLSDRITQLLETRIGSHSYIPDMTEVEKALDNLAITLTEHYYPLIKDSLFKENRKQEIIALTTSKYAPLTTAELNQKLKAILDPALVKATIEIAKAKYLARLAEIDAEVSADTQITLAEEAIRRQLGTTCCVLSYKVNALLGEYARVFRDIKRQKEISAEQATVMLLGAAYLDQRVVIERALELGADINATSTRDPLARTAIMLALEAQNADLAKVLVENGANVSATDNEGNSVMHYAVRGGNILAVKALAAGTTVTTANKRGVTPLFIAAVRNQTAMVEALLACVEDEAARAAYANMADTDGMTAFNLAVAASSRDVLDALAAAGATYSSADLSVAAKKDHLAVAQWLIANSVDVNAGDTMEVACPTTATARYLATEGGINKHAACPKCTPPAPAAPAAPQKASQAKVSLNLDVVDATITE